MLVLLPGMDGTGVLFAPFLGCLPSTCAVRVVRYPKDAELTYPELEQHVLDNLPSSEPITLIAESFSGPIALHLTDNPKLNIRAVVLVCSFASHPLGTLGSVLARLPIGVLLRLPPPELVLRAFLLGRAASDELVAATVAAISSVQPRVLAGRLIAALRSSYMSDPVPRASRIIAIFSRHDRVLGKAARRSIEKICPALEKHWIDAPHFALQTSPDKIVSILHRAGILSAEDCG
jgi:pimeloyl-[acyl-carrier protein] methyl ester esterase